MTVYRHTKHFTVEQARMMVTGVYNLLREIITLKEKLTSRGFDIYRHQYFGGSGPNGERYFPPELERLVEIARNLEKKGILLKDMDQGLIDLPHIRSNGEEVYLCWRPSDGELGYWHEIDSGFAGRKPISEL